LVDHFFSRLLNELSYAIVAFEPLFAVIDMTIFDRSGKLVKGAGMGVEKQKVYSLYHSILSTTGKL
jgi:hypothetical protein